MSAFAPKQGPSRETARCPPRPREKPAATVGRDPRAAGDLPRDPGPRTIPRFLHACGGHAAPAASPALERPVASSEAQPSGAAATAAERQADEIGGRIAAGLAGVALGAGPLPCGVAAVAERHLGLDGPDYGFVENLGDTTINLCPPAIGERQPPDATVSPQAAPGVETAAFTILHEFFHVVSLGHPHAEEYAQLGYELRFGKAPLIGNVDTAGGATAKE